MDPAAGPDSSLGRASMEHAGFGGGQGVGSGFSALYMSLRLQSTYSRRSGQAKAHRRQKRMTELCRGRSGCNPEEVAAFFRLLKLSVSFLC